MKCIDLCLLVIAVSFNFVLCQRKESPCPSVFTYDLESDTSDTWFGTIKLQTSVSLHGITVDVIFDRRAATFGAYYFKDVSTSDYTEYRVENKNFKLNPGRTLVMNIYTRYTENIPLLKQIRLNGQNICVDLPSVAVQPIHTSNSNSQTSTKRTTRWENPNYNYDGLNYETTTYHNVRNTFATTTQSWNDFVSGSKARDVNEDSFTQFSGHDSQRPNSGPNHGLSNTGNKHVPTSNFGQSFGGGNHNDRDFYNPLPDVASPSKSNGNQGRDNFNQPRETTPSTYGFIGDSLSGGSNNHNLNTGSNKVNSGSFGSGNQNFNSINNNNQNLTPPKPLNLQTTRPTTSYDYNERRTTESVNRPFNERSTTKKSTYFQGDLPFFNNDETSTHSILNLDGDSQCGTVMQKVNPLIIHGEETFQGQFPWHAALYLSEVGNLKYICGGSLVSMNAVVTAAHCVTHSKSKTAINSRNVLVYLGKNNLQTWSGPEQDAKVTEIVVNQEYNPEKFYSDIAILKLKDALKRSNYVRPICLWNFDNDLKLIVNKLGSVPGWGYNEDGLISEDLSYVKMPVVTHETCIWSNRDFFSKVTSEKSFCAGFRNGTTICNGDSGGGMVFKQGKQFYLRGIVSISIALQNTLKCDSSQFAVFVDAAKYTTWIKQNI